MGLRVGVGLGVGWTLQFSAGMPGSWTAPQSACCPGQPESVAGPPWVSTSKRRFLMIMRFHFIFNLHNANALHSKTQKVYVRRRPGIQQFGAFEFLRSRPTDRKNSDFEKLVVVIRVPVCHLGLLPCFSTPCAGQCTVVLHSFSRTLCLPDSSVKVSALPDS